MTTTGDDERSVVRTMGGLGPLREIFCHLCRDGVLSTRPFLPHPRLSEPTQQEHIHQNMRSEGAGTWPEVQVKVCCSERTIEEFPLLETLFCTRPHDRASPGHSGDERNEEVNVGSERLAAASEVRIERQVL